MDVANDARTRALLASHGGRHAPYETTVARSIFRTTQRLLVSLQNDDFVGMRGAIAAGADVNTADLLGHAALHQTVLRKSASDIVWLLKSGANLRGATWSGDTCLHLAVLTRHLPTLELLLAAGADPNVENSYGCCPARLAARLSDAAAWHAITTHVAARRSDDAAAAPHEQTRPGHDSPKVSARKARPKPQPQAPPPVTAEEMSRRTAIAEAAAAELLASEAAEQAERARRELRATTRRLQKQKRRLQEMVGAAAVKAASASEDSEQDAELQRVSLPDDDDLFEPDWLADLLADFNAGSDGPARRSFVENSVRACASLKLQLETVQRCVVCMDGARGTVLQPCGHTHLCRACAVRVAGAPAEAARCPVCLQAVSGWAPAFL
jgi:hypothetical protein